MGGGDVQTHSAFGIDHAALISKATDRQKHVAEGAAATGAAGTAVALGTKMPEHSHYDKKTRAHIKSLPAGVHEVDTAMLAKRPRKLGARKQQRAYVAAMAQERPEASFKASPVPITRYKDGVIQRDNAHSVMANAMKGRKTTIKIEDAPGYRPSRRTGEELIRRGQMRYQQHRLKAHTNLSEDAIEGLRGKYKDSSRKANTAKRPHGVTEDTLKYHPKPFKLKRALGAGKNIAMVAKRDRTKNQASGALGAAGVGTLASTPVRRSAAKVDVSGGRMSADDAKKVLSPGYRPGNRRAIKSMAHDLGGLKGTPTTVVRHKDGSVIPFDGNHRGTARVARGDSHIPVKVVEGGERPAISVARNAYHVGSQKLHAARIEQGTFSPEKRDKGPSKLYHAIANGSKTRSGQKGAISSTRIASGPSKLVLRSKQGATVAAGAGLLEAGHLVGRKKKS